MSKRCPKCHQVESWEHATTCPGIDNLKEEFTKNMKDKLNKARQTDDDDERVSWIIVDATSCLHQHNQLEQLTTQFIVGMKTLLRGQIVKNWGDLEKNSRQFNEEDE